MRLLDVSTIAWRNRYAPSRELAVALLAARQAYPERLAEMDRFFGRSSSYLSSVYNDLIQHLVRQFPAILAFHPRLHEYERLLGFYEAIQRRSRMETGRVWGFIEGTFCPTCRPTVNQQWHYSGHKKQHSFKFQAIVTLDGLVSSLQGPYRAPNNDWRIWIHSNVADRYREVTVVSLFLLIATTNQF